MKKELDAGKELAIRAGAILTEHYSEHVSVQWKGFDNPVTAADCEAGEFLVAELKRLFPQDGIVCEEIPDDQVRLTKSRVWMVDPMDGTKEFISHCDEFAVMIGLAVDGKATLGVVYQPAKRKLYYAASGMGAFLEEGRTATPLRVSPESDPAAMTIAVSRSHHSRRVDAIRRRLAISQMLRSGSIGLKIGMICERRAHLYLNASGGTYQWDSCAPEAILSEAGGRVTDLYNAPLLYNREELRNSNGVIASSGTLHERIVEAARSVLNRA
ncbi:MAG TPA: 3'(2'),5'-bisphosphate nucleotidase CysQ [Dehalococcoidia bacterium]|jgi:3'(2'), 5'-bisphosphate nucleotidase|nr:3'(2'),5'-bisphosphate nucleotidase CysQ [Dehalococcoidia bacterium]